MMISVIGNASIIRMVDCTSTLEMFADRKESRRDRAEHRDQQ